MGKELWEELKSEREFNGMTQADVAEKMKIFPQYISDLECGRKNPTVCQLDNYLSACGSKKRLTIQ